MAVVEKVQALTVSPDGRDFPRKIADAINDHARKLNSGQLQSRTVAQLATEAHFPGYQFFCTDESGGAQPVFSDGTNWRRGTDRAIVS